MISLEIQNSTCFSCFESPNSCLQSKWFIVALAVSSFVILGTAAFGATGLFASQLPQWLAHAVGTIGHSGCLAMLMWGTVLGGACAITAIILSRKNPEVGSIANHDPMEQTAVISSEESIEILNETSTSDRTEESGPILNLRNSVEEANELPPQTNSFMRTVSNDHVDVVTTHVEQTATIPSEESIETLNAQLIDAAKIGRIDKVTSLLNRGANIEARNDSGWTPLMAAALFGYVDTVNALLEAGADLEARDYFGHTSLSLAAEYGQDQVVNIFLNRGVNIEATNRLRQTYLSLTAELLIAARNGRIQEVTTSLDRGVHIEVSNYFGQTSLSLAAEHGHAQLVSILLERRANINATDQFGRTAIDHARTDEIRQILLNWSAAHSN